MKAIPEKTIAGPSECRQCSCQEQSSAELCCTTDLRGIAVKCIIAGEHHIKQCGPGDKSSPKVKTPEKEASHILCWVETKTVESK